MAEIQPAPEELKTPTRANEPPITSNKNQKPAVLTVEPSEPVEEVKAPAGVIAFKSVKDRAYMSPNSQRDDPPISQRIQMDTAELKNNNDDNDQP